jgi:hypothetical protein
LVSRAPVAVRRLPWTLGRVDRAPPKQLALAVAALGLALHGYEQLALSTAFSLGWLLWALLPYAVCLLVLFRSVSGVPALCGVLVAFAFDLIGHYNVFIHPTSSTAALALIFVPLWGALIFCPAAMLVAWLSVRRRRARVHHAP